MMFNVLLRVYTISGLEKAPAANLKGDKAVNNMICISGSGSLSTPNRNRDVLREERAKVEGLSQKTNICVKTGYIYLYI